MKNDGKTTKEVATWRNSMVKSLFESHIRKLFDFINFKKIEQSPPTLFG
jgi:hypothetical protein